mmetsp:Transcript_24063/g.54817  ORF Transcript_24063/g.54817 Transcript_24063/m.54817 type:complete len:369 (+) Transcript_24063:124-1230(+)
MRDDKLELWRCPLDHHLGASDLWVTRLRQQAALPRSTLATLQQHVSAHPPGGTPGVLDLPVIGARQSSVPDGQHTVVQRRTASTRQHTAAVQLEHGLVGLNGDGNRLLSNSRHHVLLGIRGHILVPRHAALGKPGRAAARLARPVGPLVRVAALSAKRVGFGILEGGIHQASVASLVAVSPSTIHELLLTKAYELACADLVGTLQRPSCRERPARPTLPLVLHWGHSTLAAPVHGGGQGLTVVHVAAQVRGITIRLRRLLESHVGLRELIHGQVSKLVHTQGVGVSLGVLRLNELDVRGEHALSLGFFAFTVVGLRELGFELLPLSINVGHSRENHSAQNTHAAIHKVRETRHNCPNLSQNGYGRTGP